MDDLSIIDRFTETFSRYIDSGFGLLAGDVGFLTSVLWQSTSRWPGCSGP